MPRPSFTIGQTVPLSGFFGKALYLRLQPAAEVERRVGYRAGRLRQGWWLLFLTRMPGPDDFEVAGYSQMSGGVAMGHVAAPPDPRTAEARLRSDGVDMQRVKQNLIAQTFRLSGPERLAKVVPVADEHGEPGIPDYPPGSGIPQWKLKRDRPLPWKVVASIGPGEMYRGNYV